MRLKLIPTLVYLVLLPILLALGNWQLNRANEKRQLLDLQEKQSQGQSITLTASTPADPESLRYKNVSVKGRFDVVHQFLLDNQIHAGKAGYFVLTPFILSQGNKAVLVNRGWLPANPNRTIIPAVDFLGTSSAITGRINQFPSVGIKLPNAEIPGENWPALVQLVDSRILEKKLGYPLFPFQVELDKNATNGYIRDWQITTAIPPEKHFAYAMQWFALALTLTLLFVVYHFKNKNA
jgi:surfeit locus 1 family protein